MGGTGINAVSGRVGLLGGLGVVGIGTACCMTAGVGGVATAPSPSVAGVIRSCGVSFWATGVSLLESRSMTAL